MFDFLTNRNVPDDQMYDFLNKRKLTDDWNFDTEQEKINRKKKLAQQMQDFKYGGDLQFLPGGYTAGGLTNPLSTIANLATKIMGAKMIANTEEEQSALNKASRDLYDEGVRELKKIKTEVPKYAKNAAGDAEIVNMFANEVPPGDVQYPQTQPAANPTTQTPAQTPAPKKAKVLTNAAGGGKGRGTTGGPTAQEQIDYRNQQDANRLQAARNSVDVKNLQEPMQVYPMNPAQVGQEIQQGVDPKTLLPVRPAAAVQTPIGIDNIGVSRMTPQQMEATVKPYTTLPDTGAGAGRGGQGGPTAAQVREPSFVGAGGGRGGQGGPTAAQMQVVNGTPVDYFAEYQKQADEKKAREDIAANQQFAQEFALKQAEEVRQKNAERTDNARRMLVRSGAKGQKVVDAMDAAELSPENKQSYMAVGDRVFDTKTGRFINDGKPVIVPDGSYVIQNGQVQQFGSGKKDEIKGVVDTPEGQFGYRGDGTMVRLGDGKLAAEKKQEDVKAEKARQTVIETTNKILQGANALYSSGDLELAGSGVMNSAGNYLNKSLGVQSKSASARARIDGFISSVVPQILADLSASGASPNKVADTEKEMKRLIASRVNLDYDRMTPDELKQSLKNYVNDLVATVNKHMMSDTPATQTPVSQSPSMRRW